MSRTSRFFSVVIATCAMLLTGACSSDKDADEPTGSEVPQSHTFLEGGPVFELPVGDEDLFTMFDTAFFHNGIDLECWYFNPFIEQSPAEQRTTCLYELEHADDDLQEHRDNLREMPWEKRLRFARNPSVPTEAALTRLVQLSCSMDGDQIAFWVVASSAYDNLIARGIISEESATIRQWPRTLSGAYSEMCEAS